MKRWRHGLLGVTLLALAAGCSAQPPPSSTPEPGSEPAEGITATAAPMANTATTVPAVTPSPAAPATTPALAVARELLREGSFDEAARAFRAIAANASDRAVKGEALLGEGMALYELGDRHAIGTLVTAAREAPEGSITARRAAYLAAFRSRQSGSASIGATVLLDARLYGPWDALQPYIVAEYGFGADAAGNAAGADAAWNEVLAHAGVPASVVIEIQRARLQRASDAGDSAAQMTALTALVAISEEPGDRFLLAQELARAGNFDGAAAQWRTVLADSPGSKYAILSIGELERAGYAVDAGQAGLAYYRQRAFNDARRVLSAAVAEAGLTPGALAFRLYYLAASYEDGGNPREAVAFYDRAAEADPTSRYAHRARYWAARSLETVGELMAGAARYRDLARSGPAGEFTAEAAFRAGYLLLRVGDPAGAIEAWAGSGAASPRMAYWRGRAFGQLGRAEESRGSYEQAAGEDPHGFYGVEAARELGRSAVSSWGYRPLGTIAPVDWSVVEAWAGAERTVVGVEGTMERARAFAAMGLRSEAAAALSEGAGGADAGQQLALCEEARNLGLNDVAARLALELARGRVGERPRDVEMIVYPLDYVKTLVSAAEAGGVDPLLVAAMVRQESFWEPTAGSHAGALGLTQVIPPTGAAISAALGVSPFEPSDLFRPAVSLRFGAYYLGGQLRRFGDAYQALAAYNAGPGNAVRWAPAGGVAVGTPGQRAADYVEGIDIGETRAYVELVMDSFARYSAIYRGTGSQ